LGETVAKEELVLTVLVLAVNRREKYPGVVLLEYELGFIVYALLFWQLRYLSFSLFQSLRNKIAFIYEVRFFRG